MARNIRRTGVPATIKGKANPEYTAAVVGIPTAERLAKSAGHFTVGDDKQGTRIYHFHDCALDRLYSRIARQAKGQRDEDAARREYAALLKYRHHWHSAGLEPSPKSVDLDRIFCPDAGSMSGMASSERQAFHRQQYRIAAEVVGHKGSILLDNFVCYDWNARIASEMSPYLFRKAVRDAGQKLARHWGI